MYIQRREGAASVRGELFVTEAARGKHKRDSETRTDASTRRSVTDYTLRHRPAEWLLRLSRSLGREENGVSFFCLALATPADVHVVLSVRFGAGWSRHL